MIDRPRRAIGGARVDEAIVHVGRDRDVAVALQALEQRLLVLHLDVERVDQRDRGFLARVDARGGTPKSRSGPAPRCRAAAATRPRARLRRDRAAVSVRSGAASANLAKQGDGRLMSYSLYIVRCADGTLYTGIAVDVARRVMQHNGENAKRRALYLGAAAGPAGLSGGVSRRARPPLIEEARIKRLTRAEKQRLIDSAARTRERGIRRHRDRRRRRRADVRAHRGPARRQGAAARSSRQGRREDPDLRRRALQLHQPALRAGAVHLGQSAFPQVGARSLHPA